jgi:hypothetical protein
MRNLGATVIDPTGRLGGGDIDDLLSPYDCEVKPYRGVKTPAGWEWVPQGVFGLTARNVVGDGQVQLTGQDRAMIYQGGMPGQVAFNFGTPVEQAIQTLLNTRQPGLQMNTWNTGYAVGPLLYQADIDVWNEAQKLAQSVGGWLWHDREGCCTSRRWPRGAHFGAPVHRRRRAAAERQPQGGLRHHPQRRGGAELQQQTATGGALIISAMAADTDPTSPTYYKGATAPAPR